MKRLVFLAAISGLTFSSALMAQTKQDLLSIQRDVADLQDRVRQLQSSQDEKMAALQALVQQALDSQTKMSASLATFERGATQKLADQQDKIAAPLAAMGGKIDSISDNFSTMSSTVADLQTRMRALDAKLSDISNAVRTLSAPPPAPAPAPNAAATPAAPQISAETLLENARRDYSKGNFELALSEYNDYTRLFPDSADAPGAAYYIGYIYYNNSQWDSAVKAFDKVDQMPESSHYTSDALYYKAVSLTKLDQRTEAGSAFKDYVRRYPHGDHVAAAHQNLQHLGMEARPRKRKVNP